MENEDISKRISRVRKKCMNLQDEMNDLRDQFELFQLSFEKFRKDVQSKFVDPYMADTLEVEVFTSIDKRLAKTEKNLVELSEYSAQLEKSQNITNSLIEKIEKQGSDMLLLKNDVEKSTQDLFVEQLKVRDENINLIKDRLDVVDKVQSTSGILIKKCESQDVEIRTLKSLLESNAQDIESKIDNAMNKSKDELRTEMKELYKQSDNMDKIRDKLLNLESKLEQNRSSEEFNNIYDKLVKLESKLEQDRSSEEFYKLYDKLGELQMKTEYLENKPSNYDPFIHEIRAKILKLENRGHKRRDSI